MCNIFIFVFLFTYEPKSALLLIDPQTICYTVLLTPFLYANASVAQAIRRLLIAAPACCCPPPYLFVRAARHLHGPLASISLASGSLSRTTAPAVTSLHHPQYLVSVICTPPCTWRYRGEGYLTSLFLVTSEPLRSQTYPNIPASTYY